MKLRELIKELVTGRYFPVLLLICFSALKIYSQAYYSVNPDYIKTKTEGNNISTEYQSNYPDSSVSSVHEYFPRNFSGNIGMPSPAYLFKYGTNDLGFRFYKTPYSNDLFTEKDVQYYRTKGPFANLTGVAGSKQFQAFKMLFTHTFRDKINVTLKFNRYTSQGYYLRQQTFTNNFCLTSNFTNTNKRAGYYFYFVTNGNKHQENGGISSGTLSDSLLTISKDLLAVKLSAATRDNKNYKMMLNPWFRLNKGDSSAKTDHFIDIKTRANLNIYKYKDGGITNDNYYILFYLDTARTNDSSRVAQLFNEINYTVKSRYANYAAALGYRNEINQVWQKGDSTFINHIAKANFAYTNSYSGKDSASSARYCFNSVLDLQYVLAGANAGDLKVESNTILTLDKKKKQTIFLNILFENRKADYIYNYWLTNNFTWFNNGYGPQQITHAQLGYSFGKNFTLGFLYQGINNYLYFDNVAQPRQYAGQIQNTAITAGFQKVFLKHLGVYINDVFQTTSNNTYVSAPPNILTARLFYSGNFKDKMQINYGLQLQYYSSFYGYAYMPASQAFYLQDRVQTGEYPFVDVYLNARIRPVTVFLKIENALQGFAGTKYSFVPGYYQTDRAFRFGITWLFFD